MDLLVIGTINIHSILRTSLKPGALNPVSEYRERFSGSTLGVALNASLLGADVGIIAPVGRDATGLMDILRRYSVDYSNIVLSSQKTPNYIELYTARKHYTMYYEGATSDLDPDKIAKDYLKQAKIVHICFPDSRIAETIVKRVKTQRRITSTDTEFADVEADIVFTARKREGKTTVVMDFEKGIEVNGKIMPSFIEKDQEPRRVKDAFVAGFLVRYLKSERTEPAVMYGLCAAYLCSRGDQRVLSCAKEDVDTLFDEKMKTFTV
ncbi:MAG: carbohydrate kinase family protein [Theionarchaea archaeon]|nr:carbohydrate kinase family protein [Theionarchaea archaeon]